MLPTFIGVAVGKVSALYEHDEQLQADLAQSFAWQRNSGLICLPKRLDHGVIRIPPAIQRAEYESEMSLRVSPSTIILQDQQGLWTVPIGRGLFASMHYDIGQYIVTFKGSLMPKNKYEWLAENGCDGYGISFGQNMVMNCYHYAKKGECKASMANNGAHNNVRYRDGGKPVLNAKLSVNYITKQAKLRALIKITHDTEILWDYSDAFFSMN